MEIFRRSLFWIICAFTLYIITADEKHPDIGLPVTQLVKKYGYPQETHRVLTEDGYILTMHRIPYGRHCNSNCSHKPVLLMHGLLCSSVDWVNTGPSNALAYILADNGFDVWLGNARGNTHSRKHRSMDPDTGSDFWQFSWNEIGYYDLPAKIDYILNYTRHKDIFYIGHSQGTTSFFVMASERPEYNSKIRLMIALAPIAFMSNMENLLLRYISIYHKIYETSAPLLGFNEFLPNHELLVAAGQTICQVQSYYIELCSNSMFLIAGWNSQQLNRVCLPFKEKSLIPVILSNTPAGASMKQIWHYSQEIRSGRFRKYDFGIIKNRQLYNSAIPPDYKLNNIKAPVALFYSENDALASVVDVEKFAKLLPNLVVFYKIPLKTFNHLDYMWAIDVVQLVYKPMLTLMRGYVV